MKHLVKIEVDGVAYEVLPRTAEAIENMRGTIGRMAAGVTSDVSVVESNPNGDWMGRFSIGDDGGYDRLASSLGQMQAALQQRALIFQGNAPPANRSTARN